MKKKEKQKLGFALCGSFCTFEKIFGVMEQLAQTYDMTVIMSPTVYGTDSRFGRAADFIRHAEALSGKKVLKELKEVEPFGPKALLDLLLIAPCTGNSLAKLAAGIADTSVTLAAKAHLRNDRPLILAPSSNDGLAGNAKNIGELLNRRNVYFVPFGQDDPDQKPRSLVAHMERIPETLLLAAEGQQIQPILY